MPIRDIAIISIPVSDPQRSRDFFRDRLGFEVLRDNPMGPDRQWIQLGPPGGSTSLTLVTWFEQMQPGSVTGIVLDTADLDATHAELVERGLELGEVQSAPWGRFATFDDPDGNGFVIQETAPGA